MEQRRRGQRGAAVTSHKSINNKSGPPAALRIVADQLYTADASYMSPKGKVVDATAPAWVVYWLLFSATVMAWDAGYVFSRDYNKTHPILSYVYYPYNAMYVKVDAFYGNAASAVTVPWAKSQSQINVLEVVGQLLAAALSSGSIGTVFGLVVSTSTLVKTVLYMLMIYNHPRPVEVLPCVNRATPAEAWDFWVLFVLTNGWWIVMPALVVRTLSERLIAATQSS